MVRRRIAGALWAPIALLSILLSPALLSFFSFRQLLRLWRTGQFGRAIVSQSSRTSSTRTGRIKAGRTEGD